MIQSQDKILFDCFIRYSLLAFDSQSYLQKIQQFFNINVTFYQVFSMVKYFENFDILSQKEFTPQDIAQHFAYLFQTLVGANMVLDIKQLNKQQQ